MKELIYNREKAVEYAKKWAFSRNPYYYNFDDDGGDCTNFISQCVYAGAGVMNYTPTFGWYYNSPYSRAPAWSGVEYFYNFFTTNKKVGPYGKEADLKSCLVGDVIQLMFDDGIFHHTTLINRIEDNEIYLSAHTFDAFDRPLSSYIFNSLRAIHIEGVRDWG